MVSTELPSDLHEDILFGVPPRSLVRFKSVCKKWNNLVNSKRFGPEIVVKTQSHMYSISIDLNDDPTIKVSYIFKKKTTKVSGLSFRRYHINGICDGYFFMEENGFKEGCLVWNPLLGHTKFIAKDDQICGREMGYDGRNHPEKSYKIIGRCSENRTDRVAVLEFATNKWKITHLPSLSYDEELASHDYASRIFLNGNVYWTGYNYPETGEYFIEKLDFSKERTKIFCKLPCEGEKASSHTRALSVYKGDRFSVLQQRICTGEIKIWVTENKIGNGDDVVWIKFMTVSRPDFPIVFEHFSYFVEDNVYGKSFVLCCRRKKPRRVWVYIVRGDLCKKFKIDGGASKFRSYVYIPSLITIS